MKRGGFLKRRTPLRTQSSLRTSVSLKRTGFNSLRTKVGLRKSSRMSVPTLERALWLLCKALIRKLYPARCYTCGQSNLKGRNWQTGHMWPKATLGAYLKYDLRVLRPQCYRCNIDLGGNGAEFYTRMLEEIGKPQMAKLVKDKSVSVRALDHYTTLIAQYSDILKDISETTSMPPVNAP